MELRYPDLEGEVNTVIKWVLFKSPCGNFGVFQGRRLQSFGEA